MTPLFPNPNARAALAAVVAATLTACQSHQVAMAPARPAMTNAEYEMAQLRALGAVGEGRPLVAPPSSVRTTPDLVRGETTRLVMPVVRPAPRSSTAVGTLPLSVAGRPAPGRTGPVQKVGSSYIGPGGVTSRRVGSIMLNSDGTTGQLIGNTIINH
ncbi:MAG: hypothetical protein WEC73_01670 [Chthoniobacterales bacterium]